MKHKDKCVSCKKDSLYDKETHIDFRIGYIEGAGQLCLDCFDNLYFKSKKQTEVRSEKRKMVGLR